MWNLAGVETGRESRWAHRSPWFARARRSRRKERAPKRLPRWTNCWSAKSIRPGRFTSRACAGATRSARSAGLPTARDAICAAKPARNASWPRWAKWPGARRCRFRCRATAARPGFLLLPAWQPLASLFVSVAKEWAFWTPEGYYDASINGYTLFGWQVNRGLAALPAFYRADQFRRKLEQPGVLERLLPAGSLQEAFGQARLQPRGELQNAVPEQIAITPTVEILRPRSGLESAQNAARVAVKINAPGGREDRWGEGLCQRRRGAARQTDRRAGEGDRVVQTYEWQVPLPADETNLIQVFAGTDGNVTGLDEIQVRRIKPVRAARPRMHIRVVGINTYADPAIPPLSFPVADAQAVLDVLKARAGGMYAIESASLLAGDRRDAAEMARVPANARQTTQGQRRPRRFDRAVSGRTRLGRSPVGRILLHRPPLQAGRSRQVLCRVHLVERFPHSRRDPLPETRAVGHLPQRGHPAAPRRNVKAAVRQLQDDVIFTLAASKGEQQAAENRAWKHGVFTKCLLESLEGKGNPAGGRDVMLKNVVAYVEKTVPRITGELTKGAKTQQPTAAPDELMGYIRLPLTRTPPPGASSSSNDAVPSKPKP